MNRTGTYETGAVTDVVDERLACKKSTNTLTLGARYQLLGHKARNMPA
jgi:hypothetical protein